MCEVRQDSRKRYLCSLIFDVFREQKCFTNLALEVLKEAQEYLLENTPVVKAEDLSEDLCTEYIVRR